MAHNIAFWWWFQEHLYMNKSALDGGLFYKRPLGQVGSRVVQVFCILSDFLNTCNYWDRIVETSLTVLWMLLFSVLSEFTSFTLSRTGISSLWISHFLFMKSLYLFLVIFVVLKSILIPAPRFLLIGTSTFHFPFFSFKTTVVKCVLCKIYHPDCF